jgi:predicted ATPase
VEEIMLSQIYVDNYKCFVNCEVKFDQINLLMGDNGVGKTSAFEVLRALKNFVIEGARVSDLFPMRTLTRWEKRNKQTFELGFAGNGGNYKYRLVVEHELPSLAKNRVYEEKLLFDGNTLFSFEVGRVHLYRDDYSVGPNFPFDWNGSALATVGESADNRKLIWFRDRLRKLHILQINPLKKYMSPVSAEEDQTPQADLSNFASWYRHLWQQDPGALLEFFGSLTPIIAGFRSLKFASDGEKTRILTLEQETFFNAEGNETPRSAKKDFAFDELSDGQRQLIALYTILHFGLNEDTTYCLDEPDNFVSLREIQPWLMEVDDRCQNNHAQTLFISHHPEIINYFASANGLLLTRQHNGPVRVRPFSEGNDSGLEAAELVARGWENE